MCTPWGGPAGGIPPAPFYIQHSFLSTEARSQDAVSKNLIVTNLHYPSDNSYNLPELAAAETGSPGWKSWQRRSQRELWP